MTVTKSGIELHLVDGRVHLSGASTCPRIQRAAGW
jgi:hypothetical protein